MSKKLMAYGTFRAGQAKKAANATAHIVAGAAGLKKRRRVNKAAASKARAAAHAAK